MPRVKYDKWKSEVVIGLIQRSLGGNGGSSYGSGGSGGSSVNIFRATFTLKVTVSMGFYVLVDMK